MTPRFFVPLFLAALAALPAQAQTKPPAVAAPAQAFVPDRGIDPNELAVDVANKSVPVLCAEKDNIELDFVSPAVRQFRIQAVHPTYINTIASDRWAPSAGPIWTGSASAPSGS